jgi:hypothetical protein
MPDTDEDVLRDLLHSSLDDLSLAPGAARAIVTRQRHRELRRRFATVGVTGVAAAAAVAVVVGAETGPASPARPARAGSAQAGSVQLTKGQVVLDALAVKAAAQPATGRYAVLVDERAPTLAVTVFDSSTGDVTAYQKGGGAPGVLTQKHGSLTSAQLAAQLPTSVSALRATLIKLDNANLAQAAAIEKKKVAIENKQVVKGGKLAVIQKQPAESNNSKVVEEAVDYLYNPLVPAAQRSALFKVLAAIPGIQVSTHSHDSLGRSAIRLRYVSSGSDGTTTVFENPATTRPFEEAFSARAFSGKDILKSITFTSKLPANPFKHG